MQKLSERRISAQATIVFQALGCKLNRYELEWMRSKAEDLGLVPVDPSLPAQVVVINTCAVTGEASRDSRRKIRTHRKRNQDTYIIVTGCDAETSPETMRNLDVDLLLSNQEKEKFFECLKPEIQDSSPRTESSSLLRSFQFQSRPFLKIQDGCDAFCSYCIIPRARGRSRSVPRKTVIAQVRELAAVYPEIVLSGVNLGNYEDGPGTNLTSLIRELCQIENLCSLRISSLEPQDLSDELIELTVSSSVICNHLHLPLQGAHDVLLKGMRRQGSLTSFRDKILKIKALDPMFCVGTDLMVGFPGETEDIFEESLKNLTEIPIDYFHVFRFSPRDKTLAERLLGQVPGNIKKDRCRKIIALAKSRKAKFFESQVNRMVRGSLEKSPRDSGLWMGLTHNYIPFVLKNPPSNPALKHILVQLEDCSQDKMQASLVEVLS
jgi:threonylcarbamoyladenosine tRNA methylthiotransferase MtaB